MNHRVILYRANRWSGRIVGGNNLWRIIEPRKAQIQKWLFLLSLLLTEIKGFAHPDGIPYHSLSGSLSESCCLWNPFSVVTHPIKWGSCMSGGLLLASSSQLNLCVETLHSNRQNAARKTFFPFTGQSFGSLCALYHTQIVPPTKIHFFWSNIMITWKILLSFTHFRVVPTRHSFFLLLWNTKDIFKNVWTVFVHKKPVRPQWLSLLGEKKSWGWINDNFHFWMNYAFPDYSGEF